MKKKTKWIIGIVVALVVIMILGPILDPSLLNPSSSETSSQTSSETSSQTSSETSSETSSDSESTEELTVPIIAGSNAYDITVSLESYDLPSERLSTSDGFQFSGMNEYYSYTLQTDKDYAISYAQCMALSDEASLLSFFATFPYDAMDQEAASKWVNDNLGTEATTQIGDAIYTLSNGNQGPYLEISAVGREEYLKQKLS